MVELVKTHTFIRKHATGKAKIELHVLTVERGLSWEAAKEKWEDLVGNPSEEGFYISHQVRNGKSTAILAASTEKSSRYKALAEKGSKKKDKTFIVYRPNTGQQVSYIIIIYNFCNGIIVNLFLLILKFLHTFYRLNKKPCQNYERNIKRFPLTKQSHIGTNNLKHLPNGVLMHTGKILHISFRIVS